MTKKLKLLTALVAITAMLWTVAKAASANGWGEHEEDVYNNIPRTIPLNVFSQGAQAYQFIQFGDGFKLADPDGGTLEKVTVIMQSWACQQGAWYNGPALNPCVTATPSKTYAMPVTVNVYSVVSGTSLEGNVAPAPGGLLATATETFNMPYRPSSDFVHCPVSLPASAPYYEWYDAKTQTCQDGINFPITFDLSSQRVKLPSEIIVTFSYNTTNYGPSPLGTKACDPTIEGCFYDSLNISGGAGAAAFPGPVFAPSVGSVLDVNGTFAEFALAGSVLCGTGPANTLALDASPGCYTGNHPMIEVTTRSSHHDR